MRGVADQHDFSVRRAPTVQEVRERRHLSRKTVRNASKYARRPAGMFAFIILLCAYSFVTDELARQDGLLLALPNGSLEQKAKL